MSLLVKDVTAKRGRPRGSKKSKEEKEEVRSIYNPQTEEAKAIYVAQELRSRKRQKLLKPEATRKRQNELKLILQKRYYHEFQVIEINRLGVVKEHPKYKFIGRIYELDKKSRGISLRELYFPELFEDEKLQRKIKSLKRKFILKGITAHDLRMQGESEDEIKLIFG